MASPTPEALRDLLQHGLDCTHVDVRSDDCTHYFATIVSPRFAGLARVARHRLVHEVLGERMRADIHALSMRLLAPGEPLPE